MELFSKTPTQNPEQKLTVPKTETPTAPAAPISDTQFSVMPEQFLPVQQTKAKTESSGINIPIVAGLSVLFIALVGGLLYVLVFSKSETTTTFVPALPDNQIQTTTETATTTPEQTTPQNTVVSASAYGADGRLRGQLSITIPDTIVAATASSVGIAVLDQQEVSLPTDSIVVGGLYSVYPAGATFIEPLSFELAVQESSVATTESYPAYLRGTVWQEITEYEKTIVGYAFTLNRIPSGYIALIERTATSTTDAITATPVVTSVDTDSDGLTDAEEVLFETSKTVADTDADGYSDAEEITNGYSPLAGDGIHLTEGDLFKSYTNQTYGYHVSYPVQWLADSLDQTNKQVLFISDTEEFFEVLVEENPSRLPVIDWYRSLSPSLAGVNLAVTVIDGVPAVWSPNGLTLYVAKDGLVYIINYNNGISDSVSWPFIFKHFYESFSFGDTVTATTAVETVQ